MAQLSEHYSVDGIYSREGYSLAGLAAAFGYDLSLATERIVHDSLDSFSCLDQGRGMFAKAADVIISSPSTTIC